MTSAIASSTQVSVPKAVATAAPKLPAVKVDSDGDHDGSRAGEVEQATATSGSVGTRLNTKA